MQVHGQSAAFGIEESSKPREYVYGATNDEDFAHWMMISQEIA